MEKEKAVAIAIEIIKLDLKRDELYEKLMNEAGNKTEDLLRAVQNGQENLLKND